MNATIDTLYDSVIKKDSIPTHDWGDSSQWAGAPSSSFTIKPNPGEAIIIPRARIRYSENAHMGSALVIDYYVGEAVVSSTEYKNQNDFFSRFDEFERFAVAGSNGYDADIFSHEYEFDAPLVLWSSEGVDGDGAPKLNKIVIRIADDQPYKQSDDTSPINMAQVRYLGCLVCTDPDHV